MRRRAELVDGTRQRIVEAAVRLHTTVGPAHTSIAGIAEAAGVTRLTVYRHFPDLEDLFVACSGHWTATHPRPDVDAWRRIPDLASRVRRGFRELYGWYQQNGEELLPIHRDAAAMPRAARTRMRADLVTMTDALVGDVAQDRSDAKRLRATAIHLLSLQAWHSLALGEGLGTAAADLAADLVLSVEADRRRIG